MAMLLIVFLLLASPSWAAITCTGTSFPYNTPANPQTQAYTVPTVTNGVTFIGFSIRPGSRTITGTPTLAGNNLTYVGSRAVDPSAQTATDVYRYINAPSGSQTISITYSSAPLSLVITAVTCEGVDQTTPVYNTNTASADTGNITVNCTSASGQIVLDFAAADGNTSLTTGSGQTNIDQDVADATLAAGASSEPGAATVTMSHTISSNNWSTVCVSVAPVVVSAVRRLMAPMVFE